MACLASSVYGGAWGKKVYNFIARLAGLGAICAVLLLACGHLCAQSTGQGSISGTVTDSSGAVVAKAPVFVTNVATGVAQNSVTNSTGYFEVDNLNPGVYSISVTAPGFAHLLRSGITLEADARVKVPLQLEPGGAVQTITVNGDAALLNTESASLGQVLTTRQVENLTVSGSNPTWLEIIAPGVQGTVSDRDTLLRPIPDLQPVLGGAGFKRCSPPHPILWQPNTRRVIDR